MKPGHCQIQIRPLRVKPGQYRVLGPLLDVEQDCGRHATKAAAVEAILCASGVYSVWDM
jgi:hypothetical protein